MELRQLKYFARVAELNSISRAARDLKIAQPALSRHVRTLEAELGSLLFTRDGRGVALTNIGARFYDHVRVILQEVSDACADIHGNEGVPAGEIRVGLLPSFGADLAVELSKFCKITYPDIRLQIFEGQSEQIGNWLLNRTLDLGFVNHIHSFRNLSAELQFDEALFLVNSIRSKAQNRTCLFEDLRTRQLISFAQPNHIRQNLESIALSQRSELSFVHEIDSIESIVRLVSEGAGCAVLPLSAVWRDVEEHRLTASRIVQPQIDLNLTLATPTNIKRTPALTCLVQTLERLISDRIVQGRWAGMLKTETPIKKSDTRGAQRAVGFAEDRLALATP